MRVVKTSAQGTTVYHHDKDGRVISQTDNNGDRIWDLVYANGKLVAKLLPTTVYFYHTDPAGTLAAMTDPAGSAVWRADYLPFGEENLTSGTLENDFRFVGKENDKETGLYYFGARYMEAMIGRFVSPDPVRPVYPRTSGINEKVIRNPQRVNLYAYGLNNPYRYIDPDGNEAYENVDTRGILNRTIRSINDPSNWLPFRPPIIYQGIDNSNNFERVQDAFKKAQEINQRPLNQRIRDIQNNQDKWERIGERKDPKQPPGGESRRELWQNKESGELIEKHELRQSKPPRQPHPHYKEPNKKEWGF
jgi:RHS repeat-associated protein